MIGDGINDAAAMSVAHASLALSSGTELANSTASGTLYHGDLRVIPWAIALSQEAICCVRRNLRRATAYNLIGITLAAFGLLNPVVAALLMVVSSLLVTWSSARLGIAKIECCAVEERPAIPSSPTLSDRLEVATALHFIGFTLQGLIVVLLVPLSLSASLATIGTFLLVAAAIARFWSRWSTMPHWVDMSIGMLTLGNLGMLLGWWADNGFAPLQDSGCCSCIETIGQGNLQFGMWLGMLIFANTAMLFLGKRGRSDVTYCKTAMFTGGNLGMIGGMLLGGWLVSLIPTHAVAEGVLLSYVGMTTGMIAAMLLGYEFSRRLIRSKLHSQVLRSWGYEN